jgi:hypothetical protein
MEPAVNPYQSPGAPLVAELVTPCELPNGVALPPGAIGFAGAVTVEEAFEADRLLVPGQTRRIAVSVTVLGGLTLLMAVIAIASWPNTEAVIPLLLVAVVSAGIVAAIGVQRMKLLRLARRRYEQRYGSYADTSGYLSPDKLVTHTTFTSGEVRWPAFRGFQASANIIILYWDNSPGFVILARGKFASDEDWQAALEIVASRLAPV